MESVDGIKVFENIKSKVLYLIRKTRAVVDKTAIYRKERWSYLIFFNAYVLYRIFRYQYLGLMYFVGLYIIYLIVQYFTPSGLPDPDEDEFENSQFLEQSRSILTSSEGDRPVLRSLTEFNLWKNLVLITFASLVCTCSRILAFSTNLLPLVNRFSSHKALSTYEEIWLLIFRFLLKKADNDLSSYDLYCLNRPSLTIQNEDVFEFGQQINQIKPCLRLQLQLHLKMSGIEDEQVQMSSESEPQDIDLDLLNEIRVDANDIDELDRLISTTKNQFETKRIAEVNSEGQAVDLFLRNFFIKHKMPQTLNNFQQEWYELIQKGVFIQGVEKIPVQYEENERLKDEIRRLKEQLDKAIIVAEKARGTYEKLFKQKNFYKMHHQRVQQEKKKLNFDLEKLRNNHIVFEKKYDQQADKYSHLMKEKMLIKLERDRLKTRAQIQKEINQSTPASVISETDNNTKQKLNKTGKDKVKFTPFPPEERQNPHAEQEITSFQYKNTILYKTWKPHNMAITGIDLHPKKPVLATASDDLSFKLMTVPQGQLIMSGQGHKQWVSAVKFHPKGLHLLTGSGDTYIKLWDIANYSCIQTYKDHTQAVWDIDFHDTGDFFASASMDHLAKIFDVNAGKCRHSLRGHVDSVNAVHFQPYSNILATASADKTVSLWDLRTSLCVQTFFGHNNAVNDVCFNLVGDKIASCDADGILKVWDVRMIKEKLQSDCGPFAANAVDFDASGTIIGIALDKGEVKIYNEAMDKTEATLKGHEDSVQDIVFDKKSKSIFTCGADCTFRIWQ